MSRLATLATSTRAQAVLSVLCCSVVAGPFVLGRGVDVPDDFLYSVVSTWEWVKYAVAHGESPFWMPGRMGGASLYTEANQMGPLYPAMWPLVLLPVRHALSLAFVAHLVGALLSSRWLARVWGASVGSAWAAGLVYACGMFGLALFIEAPADAMPVFAWFPAILACHRRMELAEQRRLMWAAWTALALAAMLSGAHIRHAGGTCGALGIWFLLRWRTLHWSTLVTLLGLAAGATGIVPALLEFRAAQEANAEIAGLAVPPLQTLRWSFAASWLAPKPFVTAREFGLGAVLGAAFAFGVGGKPQRALVAYVGTLLLCAAGLPVIRAVLTPITFLAHPVLILYYALAMAPAVVLGALGLDRLVAEERPSMKGAPGVLLAGMVAAIVARLTPLGWDTFGSSGEWTHWVIGLVQAGAVLGLMAAAVLRLRGDRRLGALLVLLVVDVVLLGVRVHTAVPSQPLRLAERAGVDEVLEGGYLHVNELAVLLEDGLESAQTLTHVLTEEDVEYDDVAQGGEVEDILDEAPEVQARLLDRTWPVHPGSGFGWRSTSGRTKLAPRRASALLLPLARALNGLPPFGMDDTDDIDPWDDAYVAAQAKKVFLADGVGTRVQQLFGIPVAVDELGTVWRTPSPLPMCWSPATVEVEASTGRRIRRLLQEPLSTSRALIEADLGERLVAAEVTCAEDGAAVLAEGTAVVVLNIPWHAGWEVATEEATLATFPVNQIHTGVLLPAGEHTLSWHFRAPGLRLSLAIALAGLFLCVGGIRRR